MVIDLQNHPRGVVLPLKARAGARRNAITGVHDGLLQVSVTQAPEKGKANAAIAGLLAKSLGVRLADVELHGGGTNPRKRFLVVGAKREELAAALAGLLTRDSS